MADQGARWYWVVQGGVTCPLKEVFINLFVKVLGKTRNLLPYSVTEREPTEVFVVVEALPVRAAPLVRVKAKFPVKNAIC